VKDLKAKLNEEMNTTKQLRDNIIFIQAKYKGEVEILTNENSHLKDLVMQLKYEDHFVS
jgi:hypothetical protein